MTRESLIAEAEKLVEDNADGLSGDAAVRFDAICEEVEALKTRESDKKNRAARLAEMVRTGALRTERGDGSDSPIHMNREESKMSTRDTMTRALDALVDTSRMTAEAAEAAVRVAGVSTHAQNERAALSSPEFLRGWMKSLRPGGAVDMTPAEAEAVRNVRALTIGSNDDLSLPSQLDPTLNLTTAGQTSGVLSRVRRESIANTDTYRAITAAPGAISFDAEAAEVSDDSPTLADPTITVDRAQGFVPVSFEWLQDSTAGAQALSTVLLDAYTDLVAVAVVSGTGTGQPNGLVTALAAGAQEVDPATAEALAAADVYATQEALRPRSQANAVWFASRAVINALAQMETTNGARLFPGLDSATPTLLGKPVVEENNAPGTPDASATAANAGVLVYGDPSAYVFVQRTPVSVSMIPHLFGSNQRPTGEAGAYLFARVGGDVIVPESFSMLSIPTTA